MEELTSILLRHARLYPAAQVQDMVKLIYQNEFGPSHFNPGTTGCQPGYFAHSLWQGHPALTLLEQEAAGIKPENLAGEDFESIGNSLVRCAVKGPAPFALPTLCGMFALTAAQKQGTPEGFLAKMDLFARLCQQGQLPFCLEEAEVWRKKMVGEGFAPVSHSAPYAAAYGPHYRLIHKKWQQFAPVFLAIDKLLETQGQVTVAIDGCSGSGKSWLAELLAQIYSCNVFHMDDFFLPPQQKTAQRLAQPGGNVDYERFAAQIMAPLKKGEPFTYEKYSCQTGELLPTGLVPPRQLNIVEGVYSLHPALAEGFQFKIFLHVPRPVQHRRILQRSGEFLFRRFVEEWIPLEDSYFSALSIPSQCQLRLNTDFEEGTASIKE